MSTRLPLPRRSTPDSAKSATPAVFYPPNLRPMMVAWVQAGSYLLARWLFKIKVSVSEADVGKVRKIDESRIVYVCNHPTMEDGVSLFVLSARLGQKFHYIVAYEAFKGFMAWFLPRVGCYSIRRGVGDRTSISQTLTLLKQPQSRVVIFPEGGCSYQNDTIIPFRSGAFQLPLSVLAQQAKRADSLEQVPDLYVVPLSLKYRYRQPMTQIIESLLSKLENKLNIASAELRSKDNYQRLRAVAHQVILKIEQEASLAAEDDMDWNVRINRLRQIFIRKCERALEIEPNENLPLRERVYKVQALLEDAQLLEEAVGGNDSETYQGQLSNQTSKATSSDQLEKQAKQSAAAGNKALALPADKRAKIFWDTVRLLNFDAIYDGYVAEAPTDERFLDTLIRLEREVFHIENAQPKAARTAYFRIGEPINLKHYLADYRRDRTETVDHLADELHSIIATNLKGLS